MRSRYSAFVLGLADYLRESWHPAYRPAAIETREPGLTWLGLQVIAHVQQDATHATVEFIAKHKLGGRAHRHHELSRFEKLDGRWVYLDGAFPKG
jgi:SEC-C motif-containing protein